MKNWVPLTFVALAISMGLAPVGYAQPRPGDHPGDKPGEHGPATAAAVADYAARLQKVEDDLRRKRADQRKDAHAWEASRATREEERRHQLEGVWGAPFLARAEVRSELEVHADRVARIERIIDIAEDTHNAALLAHAQRVLAREFARNARVMADLRARLGVQ
jgi:hypothetical protein